MGKGYFDNAATTLIKVPGMYQHVADYMEQKGYNVGRGDYSAVQSSGQVIRETRDLLLKVVSASATKEVVFLPSATIAINTILNGVELNKLDNVYISHFEHNAVTRLLYHLQKKIGFSIHYLDVEKSSLNYNTEKIKNQFIANNPKVVIMSQVSNVCGVITPVEEISKLAKAYSSITIVDAAQACGVIDIDLSLIDYYVFEGHKTLYGPMGVGGFICDKNSALKPFLFGGTGIDSANEKMPSTVPERFEAGTSNLMAIVGLNYSLKWILNTGLDEIRRKEKENYLKLKEILLRYDFISLVGVAENSSAIISTRFDGYAPNEIGKVLDEMGVSVRTGLQCAPEAHKFLNTFPEGTVRFSISYFTSDEDYTILQKTLDRLEEELK